MSDITSSRPLHTVRPILLRSLIRLHRARSINRNLAKIKISADSPAEVQSFSDFCSLLNSHISIVKNVDSLKAESICILSEDAYTLAKLIHICLRNNNLRLLVHNPRGNARRLISKNCSLARLIDGIRGAHTIDLHFYSPASNTAFSGRIYLARERNGRFTILDNGVQLKRFVSFEEAQYDIDQARRLQPTPPIDAVVTWVNDQCPKWQELWKSVFPDRPIDLDRHSNNDELRYCLRSVWYNCPWINRIYIVSNCLPPHWLRRHPKVVWVDHEEIFPDKRNLPTFNSHAIECCLHLIPELSEHFIYFNDDFFVNRIATPEQFFHPLGYSIARLEPYGVVNFERRSDDEAYLNAARKGRDLLLSHYGYRATQLHQHVPYALRKSTLMEMENLWGPLIRDVRGHKLRHFEDISLVSFLYHHYAIIHGYAYPTTSDCAIIRNTNYKRFFNYNSIREKEYFCINDGNKSGSDKKFKKAARSFLNKSFPFPAPWEHN